MDEAGFRRFLKRAGKKEHVADGLLRQARLFEAYLTEKRWGEPDDVNAAIIREYAKSLPQAVIKEQMRAVALYYKFLGKTSLAKLASDLREKEIARTRQSFRLRDFRDVNPNVTTKLEALGIVTVEDLLAAGKTPASRRQLARQARIPAESVLELVKLSDISRLGAIKAVRARLYYNAGLDTPDKFTHWEPDDLRCMLVEFVERTGFPGIAPLPRELRNAIATAHKLPKVIDY